MIKIKKKKPMPTWQKVFYTFSFIFLISAFIYLGTKNYNLPTKKMTDKESFSKEYDITINNKFKYIDGKKTLEILKNGTGIIFMSFPENEWAKIYAEILNNAAKNININNIYYYNFSKDRANNTHTYQTIIKEMKSYLPILDNGKQDIYAPTLIFVLNGEIIYYDNETAIMNGDIETEEYWTMEKRMNKERELMISLSNFIKDNS